MTDVEKTEDSKTKKDEKEKKEELVDPTDSKDTRISRGPRPEAHVDHEKLSTMFVYDELGNKIRFTDIYKKQKTLIIFIRHFLDFITKEYVEDLALIPLEYLQEADIRLVVIGPAPFKFIKGLADSMEPYQDHVAVGLNKPFKQLTNYQYTLYCDPDREIYKCLGLHEKNELGPLQNSKHVKSGVMMGVMKSIWRAMQTQEFQGSPKQQGGSFIMGPEQEVHFSHLDESSTDHAGINDLLMKAGVQPVSFPKDKRVLTI